MTFNSSEMRRKIPAVCCGDFKRTLLKINGKATRQPNYLSKDYYSKSHAIPSLSKRLNLIRIFLLVILVYLFAISVV